MDDITRQVTLLYELSLTTLKHLDPFDTSKNFITKFLSRKALNYGAIWMGSPSDDYYQKLYALPDQGEYATLKANERNSLKKEHQIVVRDNSIFNEVELNGHYAYYPLGDFGILELNSRKYPEKVSKEGLRPFVDVFAQLAVSLKSGFSYMMLEEEVKQRKAAEESLRVNELKYRNIINNIKLGLVEVDHEENIQYANEPFLELMGYELEEIVGKKATDLFLYDSEDQTIHRQKPLRKQHVSNAYELKLKDRKGDQKWVIISGSPNYDSYGQVSGSIGIHLDITKQKSLEAENEFKSLQLKKLFEMSLDALVTVDQYGRIFEWSHQASQVFGFSEEETIGQNVVNKLVPARHRKAHTNVMYQYLQTRKGPLLNKRIEVTALKKSGEEFQIEFSVIHMEYRGKHFFNAVLRDITEMKTNRLNMEKALERLQELNDMKSQFISTTSHELRTPLTTIKSNTEIINYLLDNTQSVNKQKISKNITRIEKNADRLKLLINNILLIGQLDSQKTPFNPQPVDLSQLLLKQIIPDVNTRDREVSFREVGESYEIDLDKRLIRHVMTNLLENALKYSKGDKNPEIIVDYKGGGIEISVKDYGIGIPEEDRPKLFDTFFRASNVDNIQGTGLGLSIVKEYVKMHEGHIKFKSELNVGTTFTILLPKLITHEL